MQLPRQSMEVIFYNDSDDEELQKILTSWLHANANDFNGAKLYQSENVLPNEFDVMHRRERICEMKEKSKELISDSAYVFCLEDDTIAPPSAFSRLMEIVASEDEIAVASGVEVGRWSLPVIGAWDIEPLDDPIKVESTPYKARGTREVDGVGWYCYVTFTRLYKEAHYRNEAECLGPDVVYSWDLRRAGYKIIIDWSIACAHLKEDGRRLIPSENTMVGTWHKSGNDWAIENRPLVVNLGVLKDAR